MYELRNEPVYEASIMKYQCPFLHVTVFSMKVMREQISPFLMAARSYIDDIHFLSKWTGYLTRLHFNPSLEA